MTSQLAPAAQRGRLTVAPRVVEKIGAAASLEVQGTQRVARRFGAMTGHNYPHVDADVAGSRAVLQLTIAAQWGAPLSQVAAEVRDHVASRVEALAGVTVDRSNVQIGHVAVATPQGRRVQ